MARSAATKATAAADALLAWLDTQHEVAAETRIAAGAQRQLDGAVCAPDGLVGHSLPGAPVGAAWVAMRLGNDTGETAAGADRPPEGDASEPTMAMVLPHTDWLHHRLAVTGPADAVATFREAAIGAGVIPWQLDLDRLEEDWFHWLVAPLTLPGSGTPPGSGTQPGSLTSPGSPTSQARSLSVAGARVLAGQLRDAVARRHELAAARVGRSRARPFDLHALVPVPDAVLRLGPDHPAALAWLWAHWGTTQGLRHVAEDAAGQDRRRRPPAGHVAFYLTFWSADWTPWRALAQLAIRWPTLRFDARPTYDDGP